MRTTKQSSSPGPFVGPVFDPYSSVLGPDSGNLPIPDGFTWNPPFRLFRPGNGTARTTVNPESFRINTTTVRYVDPINGLDTNTGLSWSAAWKTITYALDTLITLNPVSAELQLKSGSGYSSGFGNRNPLFPMNVVCEEGKALISTNNGGYAQFIPDSGIYRRSGPVDSVVLDFRYKSANDNNLPFMLANVATLADCQATPGSCFWTGPNLLYVNLLDGREPDTNVLYYPKSSVSSTRWVYNGPKLYAKNIVSCAGSNAFSTTAGSAQNLFFHDCEFYGNGLNVNIDTVKHDTPYAEVIHYRTRVGYTSKDGLWYNRGKHLEEGCVVIGRGYADYNANCSTTHNGAKMIRVGSLYLQENGAPSLERVVHDVHDETESWCIDCYADVPEYTVDDSGLGFAVGIPPSSASVKDSALMWVDNCKTSRPINPAYSFAAWGNDDCRMYWKHLFVKPSTVYPTSPNKFLPY